MWFRGDICLICFAENTMRKLPYSWWRKNHETGYWMFHNDRVSWWVSRYMIIELIRFHKIIWEDLKKDIKKDNKSHIFKHLHSSTTCFDSYNSLCFKIIDKANSKFDLKIKEALHINWRKPNLNAQQNHLALTLSL